MSTVSAPGKLMLFGEHAVVYGHPCIVTAISDRLQVSITKTQTGTIEVHAPQVHDTRFIDQAITHALSDLHITHQGLAVTTNNSFAAISGFGSSAAVTVGVIKALAEVFQQDLSQRQLFDLAYKTVLDVQHVGSGFDVAAAVYGGIILFTKGGVQITSLTSDCSQVAVIVAYSGVKADTTMLIQEVARKTELYPDKTKRIFQAIGDVVLQAQQKIVEGDWERVGKLMDFNQEYLRDLGVSTQKLEELISAAKHAGAWGAKLSGAGGGDCLIIVGALDKKTQIEQAVTQAGGQIIPVTINAPGVTRENL